MSGEEKDKRQEAIDLLNKMFKYNPGATNKMLSYPVKFDDITFQQYLDEGIRSPIHVYDILKVLGISFDHFPTDQMWSKATKAIKKEDRPYILYKKDGNI